MLIELFAYVILFIIAVGMLITYKPKQREIAIPSDFKTEQGGGNIDAVVPNKQ